MSNLSGKTALVTGASRGIGRAAAVALARHGARTLIHYGHREADAEAVVLEIRQFGGSAEAVGADLSDAHGANALARQAREIIGDRLDILVLNAGVTMAADIEETTIEDFDRLFAINVRAPFFLVQQALPMLANGGSIIFVSSVVARSYLSRLPAYAATKGAIATMITHFAAALGPRGVRVNAVAPGIIDTDMSSFTKTQGGRDFALGIQALKRIATPEDIGGVVAFLASDAAAWITGASVPVDGGSKL